MLGLAQTIHHELCPTVGVSSGDATQITASGSTNTKGSWFQLTASTPQDCDGLRIEISCAGSTLQDSLIDVAVGASGSEVVIFGNLPYGATTNGGVGAVFDLPIPIATGTRIAARVQSTTASGSRRIACRLIYLSRSRSSVVSILGVNTADSGSTGIDPGGTANTKSAWVQLVASTTYTMRRLFVFAGAQNHSTLAAQWDVDIAIGGSGSEIVVVDHIHFCAGISAGLDPSFREVWVEIPAGSRIAVRASCNITATTQRTLDIAIVGYEEVLVGQASPYRRFEGARQALGYGSGSPTTVTSGAVNTLGSMTEIASASGADATGITIFADTSVSGDGYLQVFFGPSGSEVLQFTLPLLGSATAAISLHSYTFGWRVPAATRIAAKFQSNTGAATTLVGVQLLDGPIEQNGSITTFGVDVSDSGGLGVDPGGTTNTKGSWVEISSSLPHAVGKIWLVIGLRQNGAPSVATWLLDVGAGGSGSEVVVLPDEMFRLQVTSGQISPAVLELNLPSGIAAGARLAVRAACTINDATDRLIDVEVVVASLGGFE